MKTIINFEIGESGIKYKAYESNYSLKNILLKLKILMQLNRAFLIIQINLSKKLNLKKAKKKY